MDSTILVLRRVLRHGSRVAHAAGLICTPWLLLSTRVWLSQVVFVHRIMMMMAPEADHATPFALEAAVQGIGPLLLAAGLLTRPIALALLIETVWNPLGWDASPTWPRAALLAWLLVTGPGALSLDYLLGRGVSRVPFWPARAMRWFYDWTSRALDPVLRLILRVGLASSIVASTLHAMTWLQDRMLGAQSFGTRAGPRPSSPWR